MLVVLDTCILKLATLRRPENFSALIVRLCWDGWLDCAMSPAMFEEYAVVLAEHRETLALAQDRFEVCYPLVELDIIRHAPDNRFIECAQTSDADYLVTVNTARGHFDQPAYGRTRVVTPGAFVNLPAVKAQVLKLNLRTD